MRPSGATRVSRSASLGRAEFKSLGTGAVVVTSDPRRIVAATLEVRQELAHIDAACSRFRPDSELSVANRSSGHPVAVGPLLAEAIDTALRAARLTEGDVDPTVGGAMQALGYDRDFAEIPSQGAPVDWAAPVYGWTSVRFNRRWGTLHVPAGVQLDLGATAKALAADRAAERAYEIAGCGVLVSLGGDIATAGPPPACGWIVKVADWHGSGPDSPGQTVRIESGGLATSSTTVRRWHKGDDEMHHVLDPRTGRPAEVVWRTVSVAAATCVDANVASTAAIVRGESSPTWLSSLGLSARLIRSDGSVAVVAGWPADKVAA